MTTHSEFFEIGLATALATSSRLTEEVGRAEGSIVKTFLDAGATMAGEVDFQLAERVRALFLDTATGDDLSRLVHDRYALQRQGASASVVTVSMTRVSTVAPVTVPMGTVVRTADGVRFQTAYDLTFNAGVAGPLSVTVSSVLAGIDQNVGTGTITQFDGTSPQADMTVTNADRSVGGNAEETDEALRNRARGFFVNARRATLSAIEQGALEVAQVREAAAYEALDEEGNPTGSVTLIVADTEGHANADMVDAVEIALDEWRPAGVAVVVVGGQPTERDISVSVTWRAGMATIANQNLVAQAIRAKVNQLRANGSASVDDAPEDSWLTVGLIEQAARNVDGVTHVDVTDPVGTEKPDPGFIFRAGTVSVT